MFESQASDFIERVHWSGSFISYVYKKADDTFPGRAAHTAYAQALRNRTDWEVLNPQDTVLEVGDIVVKNRAGNNQTFENPVYSGFSHGDVVVFKTDSNAEVIGGNLSNKVRKLNLKLNDGKIIDVPPYFAILRPKNESIGRQAALFAQKELEKWISNDWVESDPDCHPTIQSYYMSAGVKMPDVIPSDTEFSTEETLNKDLEWCYDYQKENIKDEQGNMKFEILEEIFQKAISKNSVMVAERFGQMKYNPLVEAAQLGMEFLGFDLPKFGADGLFGPETQNSVMNYKSSKGIEKDKQVMNIDFFTNLFNDLKAKNFSQEDINQIYKKTQNVTVKLVSQEDEDFYKAILTSLGTGATEEKMKFLKAWRQAEGGNAMYNPFNTTKNFPGSTNYNSVGVKNYKSLQDGLDATVQTLKLPYYQDLVSRLKDDTLTALEISKSPDLNTWGTKTGVTSVIQSGKINPSPIPKQQV